MSEKRHVWPMDEIQQAFTEIFSGDEELKALPPKKIEKVILKVTDEVTKRVLKDLLDRAPSMLAARRKELAAFEARNFKRWREAFDLIETIWVCCEEIGGNFNQYFRPEAVQTENFVFEAMTSIHAKSLLVVAEMICLMKGGFADAALARWRTLHELNVVATLIFQEGQELALRYLAHADVQAAKNIEPEASDESEETCQIRARADYALAQFGEELKKHYGWACDLTGKKQPTFEHLELLAGKTIGRSMYKHASQHVHSNHRAHDELLGVSESEETLLLVGPSNSGMVGPLTLAGMTLVENTSLYLLTNPNMDRSIYSIVLFRIADRLRKRATSLEKRTLKAARKRRGRANQQR